MRGHKSKKRVFRHQASKNPRTDERLGMAIGLLILSVVVIISIAWFASARIQPDGKCTYKSEGGYELDALCNRLDISVPFRGLTQERVKIILDTVEENKGKILEKDEEGISWSVKVEFRKENDMMAAKQALEAENVNVKFIMEPGIDLKG